jgi:hypothetical protein
MLLTQTTECLAKSRHFRWRTTTSRGRGPAVAATFATSNQRLALSERSTSADATRCLWLGHIRASGRAGRSWNGGMVSHSRRFHATPRWVARPRSGGGDGRVDRSGRTPRAGCPCFVAAERGRSDAEGERARRGTQAPQRGGGRGAWGSRGRTGQGERAKAARHLRRPRAGTRTSPQPAEPPVAIGGVDVARPAATRRREPCWCRGPDPPRCSRRRGKRTRGFGITPNRYRHTASRPGCQARFGLPSVPPLALSRDTSRVPSLHPPRQPQ